MGCLLLLLALLGGLGYLLWNTYQLTAATYRTELRQALLHQHDSPAYQAIVARQSRQVQQMARQYLMGQLSRAQFRQWLRTNAVAANQQLNHDLARLARQQPALRGITERRPYSSLLVQWPGHVDTVLAATPLQLNGGPHGSGYSFDMGSNDFSLDVTAPIAGQVVAGHVLFGRTIHVDIDAWYHQLWQRTGAVAAGTAGLLLAVVAVFYVVLRSALRQRQLAELRTDLANNITHELKTPLSSLGIIIKSLQHAEVQHDPTRQQPLLQALARQHERLHYTVERVLASAVAGTAALDWQALDLTAYLTRYAQQYSPATHPVRFDIAPAPQHLRTDPQVLETVLGNLLDNAHKYSPPGSLIVVRGQPQGACYHLEVQDQGTGIAPAHQRRLFDKFYRAPERNLHTVKGLGLGLYLSRQAAEQVGGRLTLAASSGQGSTFLLQLPLA